METEYYWTVDSAIWQLQHGNHDITDSRTVSAYNYLREQIGQTGDITMLRGIADTLLNAVAS